MQQFDYSASDYPSCYTRTRVVALDTAPVQVRRLVENVLLFILICTVWGVLLYLALTGLV